MRRPISSCSGNRFKERGVDDLSRRYLSLVARQLREAGTHRSTAEVIDGVRLAETLSALKHGLAPTLADLRDAADHAAGPGRAGRRQGCAGPGRRRHGDRRIAQGRQPDVDPGRFRPRAAPPQAGEVPDDREAGARPRPAREPPREERRGRVPRPAPLLVLPPPARAGHLVRQAGRHSAAVGDLGGEVARPMDAGERDRAGRSGAAGRDGRAGDGLQVQDAARSLHVDRRGGRPRPRRLPVRPDDVDGTGPAPPAGAGRDEQRVHRAGLRGLATGPGRPLRRRPPVRRRAARAAGRRVVRPGRAGPLRRGQLRRPRPSKA